MLAFSECLRLEMQVKKAPVQVSVIMPGAVRTRIFTDSKGAMDPVTSHHRKLMQWLETNGISTREAAERILPQIVAGDFWVSTHPEMTREFAAGRAHHLAELATPIRSPDRAASLEVQ